MSTPFLAALVGHAAPEFFAEVAILVVVGAAIAYLCHRLGLLPIVGFLVTGVAIGPNALGLVHERELVDAVAEIGVVLLLFTIGIEFSLEKLARMRVLIFGGGGLQVAIVTLLVTGCLVAAGVDVRTSVFSGFLVALSSTAIVLKVLGDRSEMKSAVGAPSVGVLIFQDLAIIPMVLLVPMLAAGGAEGDGSGAGVAIALGKAVAIIALVLLVARRAMPWLLERVARTCSQELFLLAIVAICFGTAWLTSLAGLSLSLGAFLAGVIVSESRFSQHALGEILPLQILFNAAFFMSVGMLLDLSFLMERPGLVAGAVLAILAIKTVGGALAMLILRRPPAVALGVGLSLAQVGEFSFVLERSGREAGIAPFGLDSSGGQVLIAATVVLMAVTPLLLGLGRRLAARAEREKVVEPEAADETELGHFENHVVVAGYGLAARRLVRVLQGSGIPFAIVTLSPVGATEAESHGLPVLRGDSSRVRTLRLAGVERAKALVVADDEPAMAHKIASVARTLNPTMHVIVRTRHEGSIEELLAAGADAVLADELEGTVQLFADLLRHYAIEPAVIVHHEETIRRAGYAALAAAPAAAPPDVGCDLGEDCLDVRRVELRAGAPAVGQQLAELDLAGRGLAPETLERGGEEIPLDPGLELRPDDRLALHGSAAAFARAAELFRVPGTGGAATQSVATRPAVDVEAAVELAVDRATTTCGHLDRVQRVLPSAAGCEECLAAGHPWVHLRICMTCGHVGCCDDSQGQHATAHWRATGHPVMRSLEPGESWGWCFEDEAQL